MIFFLAKLTFKFGSLEIKEKLLPPNSSSVGEGGGVFSKSKSSPSLFVRLRFFLENCNKVVLDNKKKVSAC